MKSTLNKETQKLGLYWTQAAVTDSLQVCMYVFRQWNCSLFSQQLCVLWSLCWYDTIYLLVLKSWRYIQLSLVHSAETKLRKNWKQIRLAQMKRCLSTWADMDKIGMICTAVHDMIWSHLLIDTITLSLVVELWRK